MSRRRLLGLAATLSAAGMLGTAVPAAARPAHTPWPTLLHLPDGFHPAGIGIGPAPYAYFGSLLGGAIHRVRLSTGEGTTIHPGAGEGHYAVGIGVDDRQRLFIAGGWGRTITVMDGTNGRVLRTYEVGSANTFVDHVALTPGMAWFTDSFVGRLYGLPIGRYGELPAADAVVTLPLSGDWVQGSPNHLTATGIAATPDRRALLVVNTLADRGGLFRVDPDTGQSRRVDLGGLELPTTNGILVHGRTLYAPRMSDVAVVRLDRAGHRGRLVETITDSRFDTPCAAAVYRGRLYLPNARFPLPPTPDTPYTAVAVPLR
ncbi:superoxide dismutase [Streptomyces sp. ISL-10]|uniref:superoxide dismutase n=1 Tax=Streptomyces sp. ISL-10 TaxID=2819172 RepID=UPI0020351A71|nr:superoxide dismutase [Streptomyces sp. ISL-10]